MIILMGSGKGKTRRIQMSTTTRGEDKKLGELIDAYLREDATIHDDLLVDEEGRRVHELRDNALAAGWCGVVSQHFIKWLARQGVRRVKEIDDEDDIEATLGYDDRPVSDGDSHSVVQVKIGSQTYMVDWTAAQFGYEEFPMVQRRVRNKWCRDFKK